MYTYVILAISKHGSLKNNVYIKRGYAWRVESNPLSKQHVRLSKIDVGASNVQWVLEIPVYNQNIYRSVHYVGLEFRKHLASL